MNLATKCFSYGFLIVSFICFTNFIVINYLGELTSFTGFSSVLNLNLTSHILGNGSALYSTTTVATTMTATTEAASPKSLLMLFDDPKLYKGPIGKKIPQKHLKLEH